MKARGETANVCVLAATELAAQAQARAMCRAHLPTAHSRDQQRRPAGSAHAPQKLLSVATAAVWPPQRASTTSH